MARQKLTDKHVVTDMPATPSGRQKLTPQHVVTDMPGVGETAARHGLQGLTFGFSDELAGVGTKFGDWLAAKVKGLPVNANAYTEGRDAERTRLAETAAANPGTALASQIVGGALLPVPGAVAAKGATLGAKALRGAAVGAGSGALAGAGSADTMADIPKSAGLGALIGAGIGAAAPVAVTGAAKTAGATKRVAGKVAERVGAVDRAKVVDTVMELLPLPGVVTKPLGVGIKKLIKDGGKPGKKISKALQKWESEAAGGLGVAELAPGAGAGSTKPSNPAMIPERFAPPPESPLRLSEPAGPARAPVTDPAAFAPPADPMPLPLPIPDDARPPSTGVLRPSAEGWKKQGGRPRVVADDIKPRTPGQELALRRLRAEGAVKPASTVEMNSLKELSKRRASPVYWDAKAKAFRLAQ